MIKKLYYIVSMPVNEIRFIRQIKVINQAQSYYSLVLDILCVTYFLTSITMTDQQTSFMRQIR